MFKLKAVKNFFWNGENGRTAFIQKGEILEGDSAFKKQIVDEERLCELIGEVVE